MRRRSHRVGVLSRGPRWARWLAALTLFALAFQLSALDHWRPGLSSGDEVVYHATHCHGNPAGCAGDQQLVAIALEPAAALRGAPVAFAALFALSDSPPEGAALTEPGEPPQA
jgi:hypothetical protein